MSVQVPVPVPVSVQVQVPGRFRRIDAHLRAQGLPLTAFSAGERHAPPARTPTCPCRRKAR